MGRYVSIPVEIPSFIGVRDVAPNFGTCNHRTYTASGNFLIPSGIDTVRITAVGAGGYGAENCPWGSTNACCRCTCPECYTCCMWSGPGGGGGGYIVATVPVTPGTVCCIIVGAAGGGNTSFGGSVFAFGGCNAIVCQCGATAGDGGSFCVANGATCIVGYCGNRGGPGAGAGISCAVATAGNRCVISPWPACMTPYSTIFCCGVSKVSCSCFEGGAAGSFLGGNYCGATPGPLCSDIFANSSLFGTSCSDCCIAALCGVTVRWPGEVLLSTYRSTPPGCSATIVALGACVQCVSFPGQWCFWCAGVFGGAASHPCGYICGGNMGDAACCCCCINECCMNATCYYPGCGYLTCNMLCFFRNSVNAGCGGGGAGGMNGGVIYCCCCCNYGYGVTQYFFVCATNFRNAVGCPGNGYLVVEY